MDPEFRVVPVLYATDRKPIRSIEEWRSNLRKEGSDYVYFGGEFETEPSAGGGTSAAKLKLGLCTVSIPQKHKPGNLERPDWKKLDLTELLQSHFTIRGLLPLTPEEMKQRIQTMAAVSPQNDAFVFIHGFNVKFNEAAMRTAQIAYDFGFTGAPILYSWSSEGALLDYNHDEEAIRLTVLPLEKFIDDIVLKAGAKKIHLVAHSMGNRALLTVLERFARSGRGPLFDEIVLAAPDVPTPEFLTVFAPVIAKTARRVTLYALSDDEARKLSQKVHGFNRAGQSGAGLVVVPGIDTVDASGIDTDMLAHGYFATARDVINDLIAVLLKGALPDTRKLQRVPHHELAFWKIIPESR